MEYENEFYTDTSKKRKKLFLLAGIIAAIIVILVGAFILFSGDEKSTPSLPVFACEVNEDCKQGEYCSSERFCCVDECEESFCTEDNHYQPCVQNKKGCFVLGEKVKKGRICDTQCAMDSDCTYGTYCNTDTYTCEVHTQKQDLQLPSISWKIHTVSEKTSIGNNTAKGRYLVVEVDARNLLAKEIDLMESNVRLFDQKDNEYQVETFDQENSFMFGKFSQNEKREGVFIYDIPISSEEPFYLLFLDTEAQFSDGRTKFIAVEIVIDK